MRIDVLVTVMSGNIETVVFQSEYNALMRLLGVIEDCDGAKPATQALRAMLVEGGSPVWHIRAAIFDYIKLNSPFRGNLVSLESFDLENWALVHTIAGQLEGVYASDPLLCLDMQPDTSQKEIDRAVRAHKLKKMPL